MDIQEIESKFEELLLANPDFDESLLEKDEEGSYSDSDIQHMYSMFEAGTEVGEKRNAKAQAVPKVITIGNELQSWVAVNSFSADDGEGVLPVVDANAIAEKIEELTGANQ